MSVECGYRLENPFLLSSSVVSSSYDMCRRAFEAGWAGASFKTICNFPQHEASPRFSALKNHANAFCGFKNIEQLSVHTVENDLQVMGKLHRDFPSKVLIASIMGRNEEEWTELASKCEKAGASVIECNFSCPNMEAASLGVTIGQSEELTERFTRAVRRGTDLPVLAKLLALRFISDLFRCEELAGMHISGMGGIETWIDALEFLLLGAGSVQVTTAVMQYGHRIIDDLVEGLSEYLKGKGIASFRDLVGGAAETVVDHSSIERDTIVFPIFDYERCNGCGRCYVSCMDGGHQAIHFDPETRKPKLNGKKCVGCHLCRLVCPEMAIKPAAKYWMPKQ